MAISTYTRSVVGPFSTPPVKEKPGDWGAKIRATYEKLTFTAAGFTTASLGDIPLFYLPPGNIRLLGDLGRLICPAGTSTSDLDIGYGAYVKQDGTAVNADYDGIGASLDVGGGALDQDLDDIGNYLEFDTVGGLLIGCSFDTANSPASGDLIVLFVYMLG